MESLKENPRLVEGKPVASIRSQRSAVVQKKLDQANEDLAKLSEESLDLLFSRDRRKKE